MMNDIIADALTRIRNAALRKLEIATLLNSNTFIVIVEVLQQKEYIEGYKVIDGENNKKFVQVTLKYDDNDNSVINELKRVSKPGRRVYKHFNELKNFKNGYGTIIVTTNKGVIANDEAYATKVGGEVLCTVW